MALDFRLRDFAYPVSIERLRRELEATQYATPSELREWQSLRLERVLDAAFTHVPHYRGQLRALGLRRRDFAEPADLAKLPALERHALADAASFVSDAAARHSPRWVSTSGTSGARLRLLMDKPSNVLEFAHYWRHWSWAGYELGDAFAELSTVAFLCAPGLHRYERATRRLLLNSAALSRETVAAHWRLIRDLRPRFIKGLASVLHHLALFVREAGLRPHRFRAAFSTGETLRPSQRALVEEVFDCKAFDSYGQMERLVAITECPSGRMHVNADYGLLELEPSGEVAAPASEGTARGPTAAMIGTGLHNLSMPLIRYRIGDLVELPAAPERCPCGRTLPVVARVVGRQSDAVRTPDGRVVTALFLAFEGVPGVRYGRVVQDGPAKLRALVAPGEGFDRAARDALLARLRAWVGASMEIAVETCDERALAAPPGAKQAAGIVGSP